MRALAPVHYWVEKSHADPTVARFQYSPQEVLPRRVDTQSQEHQATNDSPPKDILDKIARDFKRKIDPDLLEMVLATDLRTLRKELKRMQEAQEKVQEIRNLRRMELFMKRFEALGRVAQDLFGPNEIMCLIWGSTRALFRVC